MRRESIIYVSQIENISEVTFLFWIFYLLYIIDVTLVKELRLKYFGEHTVIYLSSFWFQQITMC